MYVSGCVAVAVGVLYRFSMRTNGSTGYPDVIKRKEKQYGPRWLFMSLESSIG